MRMVRIEDSEYHSQLELKENPGNADDDARNMVSV